MNIEGKNPVKEALDSDKKIAKLYVAKNMHDLQNIVDMAKSKNIKLEFVDKFRLDKMSETHKHQGLIAIAEDFKYCSVEDIQKIAKEKGEDLFLIICDSIEDPHNLGSIIRVAECAGAHGVVIPNRRSAQVNPTVERVSAGATAHMNIAVVSNINDTIRKLKDDFVNVAALDMDGEDLYSSHLNGDIALVVGSEGFGVKSLTRKLCDRVLSIPMFGKVNSLNASVACAIVSYEVVRQKIRK